LNYIFPISNNTHLFDWALFSGKGQHLSVGATVGDNVVHVTVPWVGKGKSSLVVLVPVSWVVCIEPQVTSTGGVIAASESTTVVSFDVPPAFILVFTTADFFVVNSSGSDVVDTSFTDHEQAGVGW